MQKEFTFEDDVTLDACLNTCSSLFELNRERISLQIFDEEFQAFCDLEDIQELKNLSKIRIIDNLPPTVQETQVPNTVLSDDLQNLRRRSWNASKYSISFESFSLASQEEMLAAAKTYKDTQKLHKASYKLKREINDILSKELTCYSLYPSQEMYQTSAETLIKNFPFLRDPIGDGTSCWNIALKYRMQEIRRKTKLHEVKVNAGKFNI